MLSERLLQFSVFGSEWVLWLLVGLSLVSIAAVTDRAILFFRTRERIGQLEPRLVNALARGDIQQALKDVERDSLVRNVVRAGLTQVAQGNRDSEVVEQAMLGAMARERARYEARLTPLATVGNNAPFIGLFGTVLGIIQAFQELGRADVAQAASNKVVVGAIGEALVATGVGILVAIPAVAAFNWAKASIADRLKHAEALMRAVLLGLNRASTKAS
jgi:biopolymer transport protein ExbB